MSDLAREAVARASVDGCGAPFFALSLHGVPGLRTYRARDPHCRTTVADAMRRHPELVAGTGRSATLLMAGNPGAIAKDGAEGMYAAALPDGGAVTEKMMTGQRAAERPSSPDCSGSAWSRRYWTSGRSPGPGGWRSGRAVRFAASRR